MQLYENDEDVDSNNQLVSRRCLNILNAILCKLTDCTFIFGMKYIFGAAAKNSSTGSKQLRTDQLVQPLVGLAFTILASATVKYIFWPGLLSYSKFSSL